MKNLFHFRGYLKNRTVSVAGFFIITLVTVWIYSAGLNGPFVFDDLISIVTNPLVSRPSLSFGWLKEIFTSSMSGALGRPLAYISFAINVYLAGGLENTFVFKITNVIIHLVNSFLVWHLLTLVIGQLINDKRILDNHIVRLVPVLTAFFFAIHPIQLTSVLYVVQRMTSLSALFVLGGLSVFVKGRSMLPSRERRAFVIMLMGLTLGLLGLASKENAILIILLVLVIEFVVFIRSSLPNQTQFHLNVFYVTTTLLPICVVLVWFSFNPTLLLNTYDTRDFTIVERLLTESRALWLYMYLLAFPRLSMFSLFHDDIAISRSLFDPLTTIFSMVGVVLLILLAIKQRRRLPLVSLGILWFFVAHTLESSFIGLELVHEHRNYLPSVGFLLVVSFGVSAVAGMPSRTNFITIGVCILATLMSVTTFARATIWSDEQKLLTHTVEHHPRSPRSQYMYGEYLRVRFNSPEAAIVRFYSAAQLDTTEPAYFIAIQRAASMLSTSSTRTTENDARIAFNDWNNLHRHDSVVIFNSLLHVYSEGSTKRYIQLRPEIIQRIENLLKSRSASPLTITLLHSLLDCIVHTDIQCDHVMATTTNWILAVTNNASLKPVVRDNLLVHLAEAQISVKDYQGALGTALAGITYSPRHATYRILAADMLLFLERCKDAQKHLQLVLDDDTVKDDAKLTASRLFLKTLKYKSCRSGPVSFNHSLLKSTPGIISSRKLKQANA